MVLPSLDSVSSCSENSNDLSESLGQYNECRVTVTVSLSIAVASSESESVECYTLEAIDSRAATIKQHNRLCQIHTLPEAKIDVSTVLVITVICYRSIGRY